LQKELIIRSTFSGEGKIVCLSHLPSFFTIALRGIPVAFRHRHWLYLQWLILAQIVAPETRTLSGLSRLTPSHIRQWHFQRLLKAGYWSFRAVIWHLSRSAILSFPPAEDGTLYLIADSSEKPKRAKQNRVVQKGRRSHYKGYFFGIRFIVLIVSWDVYRIPVDFALILPKTHKQYQKENVLFQQMFQRFQPPDWAKRIIVLGDSAYASRDNMKTILKRDTNDSKRDWKFVFGIARTWKMETGKSLKNLARHLPKYRYKKIWIPRLPQHQRRAVFWIFAKQARLRHIGDVTIVLSKKRRNDGPKKIKLIVTNLTELTARQVLCIYQRRWVIEILFRELKSGLGLGQHQVTKKEDRIEKSMAVPIMAYLVLLRVQRKDIIAGKSWSIFRLKYNFTMRVITNQIEHQMERKIKKLQKAA